jgi:ankyrin repeat protein
LQKISLAQTAIFLVDYNKKNRKMSDLDNGVVIEGQIIKSDWFVSAINGNLKNIEANYKKNIGKQDESGCTALMYCSNLGHAECVKFLVKHCQGEIKKIDKQGRTALMYAAMTGQAEIVKMLLKFENGLKDDDGMSAYDYAVKNKHEECKKILQDVPDENSKKDKDFKKNDKEELLEDLQQANKEMDSYDCSWVGLLATKVVLFEKIRLKIRFVETITIRSGKFH